MKIPFLKNWVIPIKNLGKPKTDHNPLDFKLKAH